MICVATSLHSGFLRETALWREHTSGRRRAIPRRRSAPRLKLMAGSLPRRGNVRGRPDSDLRSGPTPACGSSLRSSPAPTKSCFLAISIAAQSKLTQNHLSSVAEDYSSSSESPSAGRPGTLMMSELSSSSDIFAIASSSSIALKLSGVTSPFVTRYRKSGSQTHI